ncbi:class I SAM-dependent methyltransferase [Sedimentitalea sp. HM32M-2]|uniref:class I SAM-dependent methyltransferase n=1 Tax=Sedimentitalea sp. HM32M-2 TaxID=3351566 RepID=UPI0036444C48
MSARLSLALETGGLDLPDAGSLCVLHPRAGTDLTPLPMARVRIVQPVRPDHDHFRDMGYDCAATAGPGHAAVLVCLPRSKMLARDLVARACRLTDGPVIVDGAKTDGIDSLLRACRARVQIAGPLAKAHGKVFWFAADSAAFADWLAPERQQVDGFVTAPGVFSADGIDPASRLLAETLPAALGRHVVDLGAGWGYLSAQLLQRATGLDRLDLVEADDIALDCARANVDDSRARFHWADATTWTPEARADAVVMNPPFHTGRAADPALGRAFIAAAARMLTPAGGLWLVANRHLPYESALSDLFAKVAETAGDGRFKVLHAIRPVRGRPTPSRTRR